MKVEVVTPEDYMGDIIGDLNSVAASSRHGPTRQRTGRQCNGAAGQHVRLRQHAALDEPGSCAIHDAFDHYAEVPQRWPMRCREDWLAVTANLE